MNPPRTPIYIPPFTVTDSIPFGMHKVKNRAATNRRPHPTNYQAEARARKIQRHARWERERQHKAR